MYTLYYSPGLASFVPHCVLRHIGAPHTLVLVDRKRDEHRTEAFLKLNPNARLPVLVEDGVPLFETAAICMHLADRHPEARLLPAPGSRERAVAYQWITYLTNSFQADFWQYFRPEFYVPESDFERFRGVLAERCAPYLGILDNALEGRTYLAGDTVSVADFYLFLMGRWSRRMDKPARDFPNLARFMAMMATVPAVEEAIRIENLDQPLY